MKFKYFPIAENGSRRHDSILLIPSLENELQHTCQLVSLLYEASAILFVNPNQDVLTPLATWDLDFTKAFEEIITTEYQQDNQRFFDSEKLPKITVDSFKLVKAAVIKSKKQETVIGILFFSKRNISLNSSQDSALDLLSKKLQDDLHKNMELQQLHANTSLNVKNELNESESMLKEFFENSQGLMCTHDLNGTFLTVNKSGAAMLGYEVEEIIGQSLVDFIPEDAKYHLGVKNYLERIKTNGQDSGQLYFQHKNGKVQTWLYCNSLLNNLQTGKSYVIGNAMDITDRALVEKDLKETKGLLEETGLVARVGGWELDLLDQRLSWTPMTKIIHEVADDYVPKLETAIHFYKEGESRDTITKLVDQAIQKGESWNQDLQIITAKGNQIWVRAKGNAIQENGKTIRLFGTFQDIDSTKKVEIEAANAKKLLTDVIDASSEVSVIATDIDGIITVFNKGAEKMLGYRAEEMIGIHTPTIIHCPNELKEHVSELMKETGQSLPPFQALVNRAERLGSDKKNWTYLCKDGEKRIVELVVTPIQDLDKMTTGYLGIAIDITEKRNTEIELFNEKSRLTAFVKHAPAAVAMLDKDMNYLAVSNRWIQDYKLENKEIIGQSHYEIFSKNINEESIARHQRVLAGAVESNQEQRVLLGAFQEENFISWEMRPWFVHGGEIGGIMMFTQNVTGMVRRKEELRIAKEQAEEASKAKSEFLANMSHEIRTPLNGVIGFTDLVLKTNLTETQNQYLAIINQSANALLGIINDILDFSKIEAGKLELDIEKSDLYQMASEATDLITYQIQKKGLELLFNVDTTLPRFIHADTVRLKQVLVNLLGNAAKFTKEGEIELKIEPLEVQEKSTKIRFSVRDTGIGINPDKQSKIFEAFNLEDSSTTKKYGGTGLGLTISNKLLGLMGSKLQLESELDKGSTFFFDISFKSERGDPIEWTGLEQIKHVMVVDDNENNRLIVNQMLRLKNIKTTEAENGFEALQLLASGKEYDVVLMDYHMPYMDGLETIRKIRDSFQKNGEKMPILLLHSSSDDQKIIMACKELQVRHRLIKPLKIQELYTALGHLSEKQIAPSPLPDEVALNQQSFKILIAEDNPINMLLAETILQNCLPNMKLIKAENGAEALAKCQEEIPDLILMDIQMPEINGYEATQLIRRIPACQIVPIIALTAGNVKGEEEKCFEIGMDDFVVKPVVESTIQDLLKKWLYPNGFKVQEGTEETTILHYDEQKLKLYSDGNEVFHKQILQIIKKELIKSRQSLESNKKFKELKELKELGHKLYGSAVSSGMDILAEQSKELEQIEDLGPKVDQLIDTILEEIDYVLKLMEE